LPRLVRIALAEDERCANKKRPMKAEHTRQRGSVRPAAVKMESVQETRESNSPAQPAILARKKRRLLTG
jgi:hypothetical protein